jgi:hypothetical protein
MTLDACDRLQAFADGELASAEGSSFGRHVASCAVCQADLRDLLLLDGLGQELTPAPSPRRRWVWLAAGVVTGAAVASLLLAAIALRLR